MDIIAELVDIDQGVAHNPALGYLILRTVLFISGLDFGVGWVDLGFEIVGLDERVIELHLLIAKFEFFLNLGGTRPPSVGHPFPELLFEQALADERLESRNRQLKPLLNLRGVLVHGDRAAAAESRGQKLPYAIDDFVVGDGDAHPLGFVFDLALKYKLLQNLRRVERFELLGNGVALLNFT